MHNLYSILGYNSIEGFMPVAIASLIEFHLRTYILLLFMIRLNTYNVYALLYGALNYGDLYIYPYLFYWIEAYVWIVILILFLLCNNTLSCIIYVCC